MTRRTMILRSWGLVLALIALCAAFTSKANAQGPYPCKCDVGTIIVADDVKCKFEVCFKSQNSYDCYWVGPGSVEQFKCPDEVYVLITDCRGIQHEVTENCTSCICITCDCWVQACLSYDEKGCLVVKISAC